MKLSTRLRIRCALVWIARIAVGATFIISGWAKAIDPWGFVIKVGEYLSAWDFALPHEAVAAACVTLACVEFITGILLLSGALKRTTAIVAAAMMAFMLPLTLYIAVADPVPDCGCFGDLWIISNWATFAKNVVISAFITYLLVYNRSVRGIFPAAIQWLVVAISAAFPLTLALIGYQVQPLVDFRPYKTGTVMFAGTDIADTPDEYFVYEKDGERRQFTLDELPDSTWTFVEAPQAETGDRFGGGISVVDADGYDIASDLADTDAKQLYLIVPDPNMHYLIYAHYVQRMAEYARRTGVEFIALLGFGGQYAERWKDWVRPDFDIYTADATALKQIVRGREALVYADGGVIKWKRTLRSLPQSLPDSTSADTLDTISAPDDGRMHGTLLIIYLASMLTIYLLGQSPKALRFFIRLSGHK